MMQIITNQVGEIISYVKVGMIEGAIEFGGTIPDDFEDNFKPSFYLLQNNVIVLNPNYTEPAQPTTPIGPTTEQVMINQLGLQVATLTKTVAKLQGGATDE